MSTSGCAEEAGNDVPPNVVVGKGTVLLGENLWRRFESERQPALVVGSHSTIDGVHFAIGRQGVVTIGDYCYLSNVLVMAEAEIRIGNYVLLGWNVAIADSDFHPLDPARRIEDTIANSPLHKGQRPRPLFASSPVIIEDDVWVGANTLILKGVRLGQGCKVEPGSLITNDVPANSHVLGNPARVVGTI